MWPATPKWKGIRMAPPTSATLDWPLQQSLGSKDPFYSMFSCPLNDESERRVTTDEDTVRSKALSPSAHTWFTLKTFWKVKPMDSLRQEGTKRPTCSSHGLTQKLTHSTSLRIDMMNISGKYQFLLIFSHAFGVLNQLWVTNDTCRNICLWMCLLPLQ